MGRVGCSAALLAFSGPRRFSAARFLRGGRASGPSQAEAEHQEIRAERDGRLRPAEQTTCRFGIVDMRNVHPLEEFHSSALIVLVRFMLSATAPILVSFLF